jgi:DNA-binding GntR family transcriptional regulator
MSRGAYASLQFDDGAGQSELALARACGGSRSQVRNALDNLTLTGRVTRHKHHTHTVIELGSVHLASP